jgi:hypothetical protein
MTLFIRIGNLTYEVPRSGMNGLLGQLKVAADQSGKPVTATITVLPAAAQRACDLITDTLQEFRR